MADDREGTIARLGWFALAGAAAVLIAAIGLSRSTTTPSEPAPAAPAATTMPDPTAEIASLEQRMRAHPDNGDGWRSLGAAYFQAQRYVDAAGAYARATKLLPDNAETWSAFGEAQTLASNAVDPIAHDAFTKALARDPKNARARYFLAVEKDVRGDHQGAIDDWLALLRDSPGGSPWAQSVHDLILQVASQNKIDVKGRLPDVTPPAVVADGDDAARAAIPGPSSDQMSEAARLSPGQQNQMAQGMVDRLAQRLAAQPNDLDGWIRLMRARIVLGDKKNAGDALASAKRAFAGNTAALARLADAALALGVPGS